MTLPSWGARLLKGAVGVVALALVWSLAAPRGSRLERGLAAPALRLPSLDGDLVDLTALRGRVVVVNFFATWCPPCRAELGDLTRFARAHGDVAVIGVAVDSGDADALRVFAAARGVAYPVVRDKDGVAGRFGVSVLPTTYVLGRDGRIARAFVGAVTEAGLTRAVAGLRDAPGECRGATC